MNAPGAHPGSLVELARLVEALPCNAPGSDKTWVLHLIRGIERLRNGAVLLPEPGTVGKALGVLSGLGYELAVGDEPRVDPDGVVLVELPITDPQRCLGRAQSVRQLSAATGGSTPPGRAGTGGVAGYEARSAGDGRSAGNRHPS